MAYKQKVTNEELIKSYERTNSVWKTAQEFNMSGQSVHERLTKLGVIHKLNVFTQKDYGKLKNFYETHDLKKGSKDLELFAQKMGRTKQFISRKAKELGLSSTNRLLTKKRTKELNTSFVKWYNKQSVDRKYRMMEKRISQMFLNKSGGPKKNKFKQGYRDIGNRHIFLRSSWENNYALYLQYLKEHKEIKDWGYETNLFWFEGIKRGCVSYTPDFKIIRNDNSFYFVEIKGRMDARSKTKIKRMAKYHPEIELQVVDSQKYKEFAKEWKEKLKNWE